MQETLLLGFALCAIFTGGAVQGDLKWDASLADGRRKMLHAPDRLRPSSSNRALACAFSSGSIGMVRFVGVEAIVQTPFRALWGIIPRKREWFNDFYIIYTWITHENTWAAHWRGKTPVFLCCAKWAMPTTCSYARPKQCWEGRDTSSHCACTRRDAPAGDAHTLRILRVLA